MVVKTRLPFGFGDNQSYNSYMQGYCQPAFKRIPKSILKSDIISIYKEMKEHLITMFDSCK
jgi:tetrahydromethanopterin S-methyltransferase subunit D